MIISGIIAIKYQNNYNYTLLCFFFTSLFLGLINSLKVPESDLINYINFFEAVPDFNLVEYLLFTGREFLFNLLNYVLFYLTTGNSSVYIVVLTSASYFLLFYSLLKMHQVLNYGKSSLLLSIGAAILFPTLFSLSAHLIRQFLASSLVMLFLVDYFFYNKRRFLIITIAGLIHTTAFFFIIFLAPLFKQNLTNGKTLKKLLFPILLILISIYLFDELLDLLRTFPIASYIIDRITFTDKYASFNKLGLTNFILLGFNIVITYLACRSKNYKKTHRAKGIFLVNLVLLLFIILNYNNTEIALRFSFFAYFLFPFSFYFLRNVFFNKYLNNTFLIIALFILLMLLILFVLNLFYGVWTYINPEKLLFLWNLN